MGTFAMGSEIERLPSSLTDSDDFLPASGLRDLSEEIDILKSSRGIGGNGAFMATAGHDSRRTQHRVSSTLLTFWKG